MVSEPILDLDVGICLAPYGVFICLAPQQAHYVYMGGVYDIQHRMGKKIPDAIYVNSRLNLVNMF